MTPTANSRKVRVRISTAADGHNLCRQGLGDKSMSSTEPQPTSKPERRPFQYSLRSLFGLTCGTAAFFSVARMLGYVDALVILAGIVVVVGIMEYPRRVHLATGILLTVVAGVLLWANLRPTQWAREFDALPPEGLDAVPESMFFRGWPLPAFAICPIRHMRFEPNNAAVYLILVLDGVAYMIALLIVRVACEFCFRRRGKLTAKTPLDTPHPPSPSPAGSTSGPPVE